MDRSPRSCAAARYAAAGKAGQDGGRRASQNKPSTSHAELHVLPFFPRPSVGRFRSARRQKSLMPHRPPTGPRSRPEEGPAPRKGGQEARHRPLGLKDREPVWVVLSHRTNCARRHQTCPPAHEWQVLRHEMHFLPTGERLRSAGERLGALASFRVWLRFRFRVWRLSRPKAAWRSGA